MAGEVGTIKTKVEADSSQFVLAMQQCVSQLGSFSGGIGKVILSLGAAGIAFGVITKFVESSISSFVDLANKTRNLQTITGASAEESSKFAQTMNVVGIDTNSLTRSFTGMSKSMEKHPELFNALNVELKNTNGTQRDSLSIFKDVISAIQNQGSAVTRTQVAVEMFGMGYRSLIPLLSLSKEQLDAVESSIKNTLTDDDLKRAREYQSQIGLLKNEWSELKESMGKVAVPFFTKEIISIRGIIDLIKGVPLSEIRKQNQELESSAKNATTAITDENSSLIDLFDTLKKITDSAKQFTLSVREGLEKQKEEVSDLKKSYDRNISSIEDDFISLEKKISDSNSKFIDNQKKLKDELDKTNEDINSSFEDSSSSITSSYQDSLASIVESHEKNLADKKKQLSNSLAYGQDINEVEIANLQNEIATEEAFLAKHSSEVSSVQVKAGEDEIEQLNEKYSKEQADAQAKRDKDIADAQANYKQQLSDLKTSHINEISEYSDQAKKIKERLDQTTQDYHDSLNKMKTDFANQMADMLASSTININDIKNKLSEIAPDVLSTFEQVLPQVKDLTKCFEDTVDDSVNNIQNNLSGISTKSSGASIPKSFSLNAGLSGGVLDIPGFQSGGIVPKTGLIYAHEGETVIPKGGNSASFSVNFYGAQSFNTKQDQDDLVNKIRKVLMRDYELSKLGVY
jgi:hypothetical protein